MEKKKRKDAFKSKKLTNLTLIFIKNIIKISLGSLLLKLVCPLESTLVSLVPKKGTKSCPTLCDPMDYNPPTSSSLGIFRARMLEFIAISFSRGSFWPRNGTCNSCWVFCIAGRFFSSEPQGKPGESTGDLLKCQSPGQVPGKLDHKDSYRVCLKALVLYLSHLGF